MHKFKNYSLNDKIFYIVITVILTLFFIMVLYPCIFVISASFSSGTAVQSGKVVLFPVDFSLEGYKTVFHTNTVWIGFRNSLFYTVVGTVINVAMTLTAAYCLSRHDLPGRNGIMLLFTFTMFFSGGIIPLYLTIRNLGIYNSIWAMVLPVAVSAYNLIVCRSFFEAGVPDELLEASKVDGCSDFTFFFKIAIPLSSTIIAVMCLFYATAMWNQFFNALMYLQDDNKMPLQVVLRNLVLMNQANQMGSSGDAMVTKQKLAEQLKYCIVVVSAAPLLIVYPFIQKYFAKGVTIGAVKG